MNTRVTPVLVAAGLLLLSLACAAEDALLVFHASLDRTLDQADTAAGSADWVPNLYDRSALRQAAGLADWQRHKDYGIYRARHEQKGRWEPCLDVPLGKGHRFRGLGNVSLRRGTAAFWVKFGRKLSTAHAPVFYLDGVCTVRIRYRTLNVRIGPDHYGLKHVQWQPGRWYHLAIAYDCTQGFKVYVDGSAWPRKTWGDAKYSWPTVGRVADLMRLGCDRYKGSGSPLMFDEVRCYSEPLAPEEIARLAKGQPLSPAPAVEPPSEKLFTGHRTAELGWDQPGDYLSARCGAGEALAVRKIGVLSARDVKCWRLGAVDGLANTRFPGSYQGYALPNRGLHLRLEPDARIDYLTILGDFRGTMYKGLDIHRPPAKQALLQLESPGRWLRKRLPEAIRCNTLSLFGETRQRRDKMDKLGRRFWSSGTYIRELALYQVGDPRPGIARAAATAFCITPRPFVPKDKWLKGSLQSHYEAADRVALALAASGAGDAVTLPGLRHTHLFIPPQDEPTPMAGLRLRLHLASLAQPTLLRCQVHDPVDVTRLSLDLDVRVEPGEASAVRVLLDTQDLVIPAGRPLWLTLTPQHDLVLDPGSRIERLDGPMDAVQAEHVRNELHYAKDRFIHVSEPRPWSRVPLKACGERLLAFRQLDLPLADLARNAPDNENVRALWMWTHPKEAPPADSVPSLSLDGAPKWALYAKEAMRKYRGFVLWWIENRQLPNGLFGSNHGDDTDLVNDWLSLGLICDPNGRIRDSVRRLADYCWNEGPILHGINRVHTDTLHAYEEGVNTQPILAQLYYGNPVYLERLMETSRTVRDGLTYVLPDGRRFFKAWWYGATHVDTEYERGTDFTTNALLLHPTLYLVYYARNPGAARLTGEWAGAWCDLQAAALKEHGPKGPFPYRVQHPTGEVVQTKKGYISGYGYQDVCLAMYGLTGSEKFAAPMRSWVDRGSFSFKTAEDWLAIRCTEAYRAKVAEAADATDWAPLNPLMGDDNRTRYAYMAWLATGKKEYVEIALENSYKRVTALHPMHTWAEQSADRVAVSKSLVDRLYLGGSPGYRNKLWPTHTVSWAGFGEQFAAWVLHTRPDELRVWIYSFEPQAQQGQLRVWGLDNGEYDVRFGPDADEDEAPDREVWRRRLSLSRNAPIALSLPPRQLMVLEAKQLRRGPSIYGLPDLAVVTTDMTLDAQTRKLTFVVHNVGSAPARGVDAVVEIDGRVASTDRIAELGAPVDLQPSAVPFTVEVPRGAKALSVTVDPGGRIAEVWEGNNRATMALR